MQLAYFINVYYIYEGQLQEGTILGGIDGTLRFVFSILGAIGIKYLADRVDKHHLLMGCILLLIVTFIGMYFTHIPGRPFLTLTMKPFLAIGEIGFWVLVISMRADVCDWDEHRTGRRREGTIAAADNWTIKLTISLAVLLGGVLLEHFVRFNTTLEAGVAQAPGTMDRLLLTYTIPPIIALVICFFILSKYPLTRAKMLEIRKSLEEQRGKAQ
jgi:GPH family glycoside/pentoside/hexuronide:cation symporter